MAHFKNITPDILFLHCTIVNYCALQAIRMLLHSVQFKPITFNEYFFTCNLGPTKTSEYVNGSTQSIQRFPLTNIKYNTVVDILVQAAAARAVDGFSCWIDRAESIEWNYHQNRTALLIVVARIYAFPFLSFRSMLWNFFLQFCVNLSWVPRLEKVFCGTT